MVSDSIKLQNQMNMASGKLKHTKNSDDFLNGNPHQNRCYLSFQLTKWGIDDDCQI
jgi:hypothetical protein